MKTIKEFLSEDRSPSLENICDICNVKLKDVESEINKKMLKWVRTSPNGLSVGPMHFKKNVLELTIGASYYDEDREKDAGETIIVSFSKGKIKISAG